MSRLLFIASLLIVALTVDLAHAQTTVGYQGRLEIANTGPVDGVYDFYFEIWDVPSGGTSALWNETQTGIDVVGGVFTVQLGLVSQIPDSLWADHAGLYLAVAVKLSTDTGLTFLQNRLQILYAPRAVQANSIRGCQARSTAFTTPTANTFSFSTPCVTGEKLVAGGYDGAKVANLIVTASYPDMGASPAAWVVGGRNTATAAAITVWAVCCP